MTLLKKSVRFPQFLWDKILKVSPTGRSIFIREAIHEKLEREFESKDHDTIRKKYTLVIQWSNRVVCRSNSWEYIKKHFPEDIFFVEAWISDNHKKVICRGANKKVIVIYKNIEEIIK